MDSKCSRFLRNQKGNMLIFVTLAMSFLIMGMLIAGSFAGVFFAQSRLQSSANEIALFGARKLNEFNRLGQMNDMLARCRQLVFASHKQKEDAEQAHNDLLLEKLTKQLDDEALDSAEKLESERHKLALAAREDARISINQEFSKIKDSYRISLPWLTIDAPDLLINDSGSVKGMQSNAQELQGFEELTQQDKSNLVDGKPTSLYRAENDAKLPIPNSPSFKFSPLAPAVGNEMAPARAVLPDTFKALAADYAPCCARAGLKIRVGTGLGPNAGGNLQVVAAAVATGGGLWQ
ncbi:MAG: hypothetical protein K2X27_09780 [Candidatus Obscuribacterales bacterium]|nr:hypothetical protein [Candidatus Obscuribacterales bacterium]